MNFGGIDTYQERLIEGKTLKQTNKNYIAFNIDMADDIN